MWVFNPTGDNYRAVDNLLLCARGGANSGDLKGVVNPGIGPSNWEYSKVPTKSKHLNSRSVSQGS